MDGRGSIAVSAEWGHQYESTFKVWPGGQTAGLAGHWQTQIVHCQWISLSARWIDCWACWPLLAYHKRNGVHKIEINRTDTFFCPRNALAQCSVTPDECIARFVLRCDPEVGKSVDLILLSKKRKRIDCARQQAKSGRVQYGKVPCQI